MTSDSQAPLHAHSYCNDRWPQLITWLRFMGIKSSASLRHNAHDAVWGFLQIQGAQFCSELELICILVVFCQQSAF